MSDIKLTITMADKLVASVWVDKVQDIYKLEYHDTWKVHGFAISPHLPLNKPTQSGVVRRFLENLIPEGKGLEDIAKFAHISKNNTFALLKAIGYDTSGALMFGEQANEDKAIFRVITDEELSQRISQIAEKSIVIWDKKERLSLAGVQEKLPVIIKDKKIGLGDGSLSSTHIMKFQTSKHEHIVINELFCMKLAQHINLNVAEVDLYRFGTHPVLMVKRFDRVFKESLVERLHVIDGCQGLDLPPSFKYERNFGSGRDVKEIREGASFSKLFAMSNSCEVPAKAKLEMLHWSLFNLIIGNSDTHGKNFSFFVSKYGIKPTPFYDMLCIIAHEGVEHDLAMAYGDEFNINKVQAYQLREFSNEIEINFKLVSQTLEKLADAIISTLQTKGVALQTLTEDEIKFIKRLEGLIIQRAIKFKETALEMHKVSF